MDSSLEILRPVPRRAFEMTAARTEKSPPQQSSGDALTRNTSPSSPPATPSRNKSFLNLTSSTLFGIYSPTEGLDSEKTASSTPRDGQSSPLITSTFEPQHALGKGGKSAGHNPLPNGLHILSRPSSSSSVFTHLIRIVLLFSSGWMYGLVVMHLHEDRRIVPVQIQQIDHRSYGYLMFWAIAGIVLGHLLPMIDEKFAEVSEEVMAAAAVRANTAPEKGQSSRPVAPKARSFATDIQSVIRGVGAFIGIAFAIRKLPWESTLQVSLTLAFVNPALWYLVDQTRSGFVLSLATSVTGTVFTMLIAPGIVPSPTIVGDDRASASPGPWHFKSTEFIGVATWIASVLFCSSVCFGNIGRQLALSSGSRM